MGEEGEIVKIKQRWKNNRTYLKIININGKDEIFTSPDDDSYTELKTWMKNYGTKFILITAKNNEVIWRTIE